MARWVRSRGDVAGYPGSPGGCTWRLLRLHDAGGKAMRTAGFMAGFVMVLACAMSLVGCANDAQDALANVPFMVPVLPVETSQSATSVGTGAWRDQFAPARNVIVMAPISSGCSLDKIDGRIADGSAIDHIGSAQLSGWVADTSAGTVPPEFWVVLQGAQVYDVRFETGVPRPDVAASLRKPALATSGYRASVYFSAVTVGYYRVAITYRSGGKQIACNTGVTVSVQ